MEDVRAASPALADPPQHPLFTGILALPGALAGGGLAPLAAHVLGARIPDEPLIFLGAFAGATISLRVARRLGRWLRTAGPTAGLTAAAAPAGIRGAPGPMASPGAAGRLHLVCGSSASQVACGAAALVAPPRSGRERTLVIDAGFGSALHAWLGGVPRLGLAECLSERVPVLGLVQSGPAPGLWLLARGGARRSDAWSELGRVLDEACLHFDRVVLAVPAEAPSLPEANLRERGASGWWATSRRRRAAPRAHRGRFGIDLHPLHLPRPWKAPPRVASVATPEAAALADSEAGPAPEPSSPATVVPGPALQPPVAPVLDCDLRVRERLRFLIWMRGLEVERRPERAPEEEPALAGR